MTSETDTIEELTIDAVKALLRSIRDGADDYHSTVKEGAPLRGTKASFSAVALKDMLDCSSLDAIVKNALRAENPEILKRTPTRSL